MSDMGPLKRFALLASLAAALRADLGSAEQTAALAAAESFAHIGDPTARSVALFAEAGKVLTSPRCVNCHPAGDRPLQGEAAGRPHQPPVARGPDGFGTTTRCGICHGEANFDPAGVPGHPHWHLAPLGMAWQNRSLGEICRQIADPARNGGRSLEQIVTHMAEDSLVGRAWAPGFGRKPAPGTQKEFGALLEAWMRAGAVCPR
jgi:hypothetical protein